MARTVPQVPVGPVRLTDERVGVSAGGARERPAAAAEGSAARVVRGLGRFLFEERHGAFLAVALLFALGAVPVLLRPINHDAGWYLSAASRLLDGARLYEDVLDANPPLVYYLSCFPVLVARLLGLPAVSVFPLFVLALLAASLFLADGALARLLGRDGNAVRRGIVLLLAYLLVSRGVLVFGQREHLLAAFAAPYLFVAAARLRDVPIPRGLAFASGGLAGVGFALKPPFLLVPLLVEGYRLAARRGRPAHSAPERIALLGVLVLYGGIFALTLGPYAGVLRLVRRYYGAYDAPLSAFVFATETALVLLAILTLLVVRPSTEDRELRRLLGIASLSFLGIAFAQGKGWDYHLYPAGVAAAILLALVGLGLATRPDAPLRFLRPNRSVVGVVFALALGGSAAVRAAETIRYSPVVEGGTVARLCRIVREHARGKPVFFFSTGVHPAFPVVNHGEARWASRFNSLWLLPGLYADADRLASPFPYHGPEETNEDERFLLDALAEDLRREPPVLLVVDASPAMQGFGRTTFDFVEYFTRDARFEAMWKAYDFLAAVGPFRVFRSSRARRRARGGTGVSS